MATEKRLIDANKPIRETESIINFRMCHHMPTEDYESFLNYLKKQPTVDAVEIDVLEDWLYEIANNNFGNELCRSCLEIVNRLDGLRVFARERKDNG